MQTARLTVELASLLLCGVLAGGLLLTRYGVRPAVDSLPIPDQIAVRQALALRFRLVYPRLYTLTAVVLAAVVGLDGLSAGAPTRFGGLALFAVSAAIAIRGNARLSREMLAWPNDDPPPSWQALLKHWDRLDTARAGAATGAFVLVAAAIWLRLLTS